MTDSKPSFWTSLPGILTGLAAVVTSVTGMVMALNGADATNGSTPSAEAAMISLGTPPASAPAITRTAAVGDTELYTLTATTPRDGRETKVRAARSTKSEALADINDNEKFFTYRQDAQWWKVKTAAGVAGYVHVSRVKVEK